MHIVKISAKRAQLFGLEEHKNVFKGTIIVQRGPMGTERVNSTELKV